MIEVLGRMTSGNVQKVIWLLEELQEPYVRKDYGRQFGNTADESYLGLNPNGKVPTVIDGPVVLWESNSILRYLAAKAGRFYPMDLGARARVERWMDWQLGTLDPAYLPIFREARIAPEQRSAQFAGNVKSLGQTLAILERGLGTAPWLGGAEVTVADICLGPIIQRCFDFEIELPPLARLRNWHAEVEKRPAFNVAIAR